MLRIISILVLVVTFGMIIWASRQRKDGSGAAWQWFRQQGKNFIQDLKNIKSFTKITTIKKNLYYLTLICFLILALSGLIPFLILGQPLSGFLLLLHVAVSPIFAILIVTSTLIWAHEHRFERQNGQWLKQLFQKSKRRSKAASQNTCSLKILFWLIVLFSMFLTTIVVSMYPLFGSVGQDFLLDFHKFSAVGITVVVVLHTFLLIRTKLT